ncbi:MAG: hypothetical protein R2932_27075 [Caldilineaceae bacterium]
MTEQHLENQDGVAAPTAGGALMESTEKVERIRDIIFGTQMRDYTQRFDTLSRELARVSQEVTRLGEQMQEQEKRLRAELRQESDRLLAQLQDQDKAHQQQLQALDQRLSAQLHDLDQKHTQNAQTLGTNLASVEQLLRNELHDIMKQLNRAKVDRPSLGELLVNLGTSLQTNEPKPLQLSADLLDQLSEELF